MAKKKSSKMDKEDIRDKKKGKYSAKEERAEKKGSKKSHVVVAKTKAPARKAGGSTTKGGLKGFHKASAH